MTEKQREQVVTEQPQKLAGGTGSVAQEPSGKKFLLVSVTALGVVFGDIGTSPLYALRECFFGHTPIPPTTANVLGVLSLIFWSLFLVISVKYLSYVMRADNGGEGGILALTALVSPWHSEQTSTKWVMLAVGVFGASLLYGDGMITPAISVLSAVEGLKVATPVFNKYVGPITAVILILLFLFQRRGTHGVGAFFGPVMLAWFSTLAVLGFTGIARKPGVIGAVNPFYAFQFFQQNHWRGFLVLGAVFLVVTGGEALYADLGHFTSRTIRVAWFALVLPALLLNYFGQGALLLADPRGATQPFYQLVPGSVLYPMVVLSTLATIIASQAVITGAYSLTRQAALLGLLPRIQIVQTSPEKVGQIFIPIINWILMIGTVGIVLGFRSSNNLASAYGVAVSTTMVITTILAYSVALDRWHWRRLFVVVVTVGLLMVDCSFFGANLFRIVEGGWVPLMIGGFCFTLMSTWRRGRTIVGQRIQKGQLPAEAFVRWLSKNPPIRVPGTAAFMSSSPKGTPPAIVRHLKFNQVLHEHVIFLNVHIEDLPRVRPERRLKIKTLNEGVSQIVLHYGFMEDPNVPKALRSAPQHGLDLDIDGLVYYTGGQMYVPSDIRPGMAIWRERLFMFMARNAAQATAFYGLPSERVLELGTQVKI